MAGLGRKFDATEVDTTQRDYEDIPDGIYRLEVEASEIKATNDKTGKRLALTYSVLEPETYKGRKLFSGINLENKSAKAQDIGQKELASLCRACGLSEIEDSEELHFIGFMAKVAKGKPSAEKNDDGSPKYKAKAEIKKYFFPDEGELPEAKAMPVAANDNNPAPKAANDNQESTARSTQNSGSAASTTPAAKGSRPWKKAA